jgi:hypothetical protein
METPVVPIDTVDSLEVPIEETYGFGILSEGQSIAIAKSIRIDHSQPDWEAIRKRSIARRELISDGKSYSYFMTPLDAAAAAAEEAKWSEHYRKLQVHIDGLKELIPGVKITLTNEYGGSANY